MALKSIPGQQGYIASRYSSMDNRAIGKFTDTNHLSSLQHECPADYDNKIIDIYTQTSLTSNDFLDMINKTTPYYIPSGTSTWKWNVSVPFQFVKVVAVPESTLNNSNAGIDFQEFELVFDSNYFQVNDIITANKQYGDQYVVASDPLYYDGVSYKYRLKKTHPGPIDPFWIQIGREYEKTDNSVGEFDDHLSGLGPLGSKIELFETLSAGYGITHKITKWADQIQLKNKDGNPLDIIAYGSFRRNELGKPVVTGVRWEPYIETLIRKDMISMKVSRMIWNKGGYAQTGDKGEVKKVSQGVYHKITEYGHTVEYPRGTFNLNLLREVFGDLFYRRKSFADRKVKLFTNEAGIRLFRQANKEDLLATGFTLMVDMKDFANNPKQFTFNPGFDLMYSMETGSVEVSHLMELDLPQTDSEFGQNKMSTPIFFVFDITNKDGGLQDNIREVRLSGAPSMTYGYVDGRQHHLGHAYSQNMSSASMEPGYKIWYEDRSDIFIEDLSRCVVITEQPAY